MNSITNKLKIFLYSKLGLFVALTFILVGASLLYWIESWRSIDVITLEYRYKHFTLWDLLAIPLFVVGINWCAYWAKNFWQQKKSR